MDHELVTMWLSEDRFASKWNRGGEAAGSEDGTKDEEVELVGGFAARAAAVENDDEDNVFELGGGD